MTPSVTSSQPEQVFQVISDLHLEHGRQYDSFEFPVRAPNLILAGDVGCLSDWDEYRRFLLRQTNRFKRVYLLLGNHEFYHMSYTAGREKAKELEKDPNFLGRLVLLDRTRYDIPDSDISILGCTLWSKVHDAARDVVMSRVKDYRWIEGWSVDVHNCAHGLDYSWLRNAVEEIQNGPCRRRILVVSHHAPCLEGTSNPRYAQSDWSCAFASDILHTDDWPGVKYWIFGHTHYTTEFNKGDVTVVSNQRGYVIFSQPKEKPQENEFDPEKVIKL